MLERMDNATLWGGILILYILPFGAWHMARYWRIDTSGEPSKRVDRITGSWCLGLVVLIGAATLDFSAWRLVVLSIFAIPCALVARFIPKRVSRRRDFRLWFSGSLVWGLCVLSWVLIFGRNSYTTAEEFVLIAILPSAIAGIALCLWRWSYRAA